MGAPITTAIAAWQAGELPDWAFMRALVSHQTWQVPSDTAGAPRLTEDGARLWLDAASMRSSPADVTMSGAALFEAAHAGLAGLRLDGAAVVFGPADVPMLHAWAAIDRITRCVQALSTRSGDLAVLRAFDGWTILCSPGDGLRSLLAPDRQGRKLAAVFTAEDALQAFRMRHGAALEGQKLEVRRYDGATLFEALTQTPGLDGVVFDCAGPLSPRAVSLAYLRLILAAPTDALVARTIDVAQALADPGVPESKDA